MQANTAKNNSAARSGGADEKPDYGKPVNIPADLHARCKQLAREGGYTLGGFVARILSDALAPAPRPGAPAAPVLTIVEGDAA
jgi:hypothetical protein